MLPRQESEVKGENCAVLQKLPKAAPHKLLNVKELSGPERLELPTLWFEVKFWFAIR